MKRLIRKNKKEKEESLFNSSSIQYEPDDGWKPTPIINEFDGFKLDNMYWFEYQGNPNCVGKIVGLYPVDKSDCEVSIYETSVHCKYVNVWISALREDIGDVTIKRKRKTKIVQMTN